MMNNGHRRFSQRDRESIADHLDKLLGTSLERSDRRQQTIFTDQKSQALFLIIGMTHNWLGVQRKTIDEAARLIGVSDNTSVIKSSKIVLAKMTPGGVKVFSGSLHEFLWYAIQDLVTDNQNKYQLHTEQLGDGMSIKEMPSLELHFVTSILFDSL